MHLRWGLCIFPQMPVKIRWARARSESRPLRYYEVRWPVHDSSLLGVYYLPTCPRLRLCMCLDTGEEEGASPCILSSRKMSKGPVGLSHLVRVFLLLYRCSLTIICIDKL